MCSSNRETGDWENKALQENTHIDVPMEHRTFGDHGNGII